MKSLGIISSFILLIIISKESFAQNQSIEEYNESIGVSANDLSRLCGFALNLIPRKPQHGLTNLEEFIYHLEGIDYENTTDKFLAHEKFSQAWEDKYSKCYCPPSPKSEIMGGLNILAFYKKQSGFIERLYSPDGIYKNNINALQYISLAGNRKGTFLDLLYEASIDDPIMSVKAYPHVKEYFINGINYYEEKFGAKRMADLYIKDE